MFSLSDTENVRNPSRPGSLKHQVGKLRYLPSLSITPGTQEIFNKYLVADDCIPLMGRLT